MQNQKVELQQGEYFTNKIHKFTIKIKNTDDFEITIRPKKENDDISFSGNLHVPFQFPMTRYKISHHQIPFYSSVNISYINGFGLARSIGIGGSKSAQDVLEQARELIKAIKIYEKNAQQQYQKPSSLSQGVKLGQGGMGVIHSLVDSKTQQIKGVRKRSKQPSLDELINSQFKMTSKVYEFAPEYTPKLLTEPQQKKDYKGYYYDMQYLGSSRGWKSLVDVNPQDYPSHILEKWIKNLDTVVTLLHHNNITHRDIKPDNIMVNENGGLKLLDYGLACINKPDDPLYCGNFEINGTLNFFTIQLKKKLRKKEKADFDSAKRGDDYCVNLISKWLTNYIK